MVSGERDERLPALAGAQDRGAVAAERREGVLPERGLAGIAHEEIQAGAEDAVDRRKADHGDEVAAVHEHRGQQRDARERAADLDRRNANYFFAHGFFRKPVPTRTMRYAGLNTVEAAPHGRSVPPLAGRG